MDEVGVVVFEPTADADLQTVVDIMKTLPPCLFSNQNFTALRANIYDPIDGPSWDHPDAFRESRGTIDPNKGLATRSEFQLLSVPRAR